MSLPVAVQLYSVRKYLSQDFASTLRSIKEFGYDGVEFAGLYGLSTDYIRGLLDGLQLVPISAHVPFAELVGDKDVFKKYADIGCKYVALPYLEEDYRPNHPKFEEVLNNIPKFAEEARKYGIVLLYHNHDFEFVDYKGMYALDYLYKSFPASDLQTEIDTCWAKFAGVDPAEYIRQYAGRSPVVHLKDFSTSGNKPAKTYKLLGIDDTVEDEEESSFSFRPLGNGVQDIKSILDASIDAGSKWVVVEQDEPSMGLNALESVKLSRDYLKTLGW